MELNVTDREKSKKEISVKLDAAEVDGFFGDVLKKLSSDIQLPGFRKGKAPANIIEIRLGRKLKAEVFEEMFRQAYRKAAEDGALKPVAYPEVDSVDELPEKGGDYSFKILVDVEPEVKLGEYKGIVLEKEKVEITDEMVEEVFKKEWDERAGFIPVEGRAVKAGDMVSVDGERTVEGGGKDAIPRGLVPVGGGGLPEEIEKGLLGGNVGDVREISVKQPDGKSAAYTLNIRGIQERRKILVDEDFAKDAGYESAEEWKEDVRKRVHERVNSKVERDLRLSVVDKLLGAVEADLPESMVNSQMDYFRKVYEVMGSQTGEPADEEKIRELAERQVKENFIIERLAEEESISAADEDVAAKKKEISSYRGSEDGVDEDEIRYSLKREKVIDFIIENASIKDKEKPLILKPDEVNLVSGG